MPSVGFEPTIPAGERPQTYALDRAATGKGSIDVKNRNFLENMPYDFNYISWYTSGSAIMEHKSHDPSKNSYGVSNTSDRALKAYNVAWQDLCSVFCNVHFLINSLIMSVHIENSIIWEKRYESSLTIHRAPPWQQEIVGVCSEVRPL